MSPNPGHDPRAIAIDLLRGGRCAAATARDQDDQPVEPNSRAATSWSVRGALMAAHDVADGDEEWPIEFLADFLALASELGYDSWRDDDCLGSVIEKVDAWCAAACDEEAEALVRGRLAALHASAGPAALITPLPRWERHCHCEEAADCRVLARCDSEPKAAPA